MTRLTHNNINRRYNGLSKTEGRLYAHRRIYNVSVCFTWKDIMNSRSLFVVLFRELDKIQAVSSYSLINVIMN
jgi:hypothetical protein